MGIDTIVTDHHQLREGPLPDALAIIDPLQKGCPYPYKYRLFLSKTLEYLGAQDKITEVKMSMPYQILRVYQISLNRNLGFYSYILDAFLY